MRRAENQERLSRRLNHRGAERTHEQSGGPDSKRVSSRELFFLQIVTSQQEVKEAMNNSKWWSGLEARFFEGTLFLQIVTSQQEVKEAMNNWT
jgi:hypothetical protein